VEDLVIDGSTEVDCMEISWKDVDWSDWLIGSWQGAVMGFCRHGTIPMSFIKQGIFWRWQTAFWDIALCSLIEVDWHFRGAHCRDNGVSKHIGLLLQEYTTQYPKRLSSSRLLL
jgi:hypothetical protein